MSALRLVPDAMEPSDEKSAPLTVVSVVEAKGSRRISWISILLQVLMLMVLLLLLATMIILPFWLQVLPLLAWGTTRSPDVGIGLVPQAGRLQPGIYTITNVKYYSLATLESSNDQAPVFGGHDALKGIHWEAIELPNKHFKLRSLFYDSYAVHDKPRAVAKAGIVGSSHIYSWKIEDLNNEGTYTISPDLGYFWSLESGDKGTEIALGDNARDPRAQWYFSKAAPLQYAVYYIPAYGPGLVQRVGATLKFCITFAVEAAVKTAMAEMKRLQEANGTTTPTIDQGT